MVLYQESCVGVHGVGELATQCANREALAKPGWQPDP